jgi:hypothetical protein
MEQDKKGILSFWVEIYFISIFFGIRSYNWPFTMAKGELPVRRAGVLRNQTNQPTARAVDLINQK